MQSMMQSLSYQMDRTDLNLSSSSGKERRLSLIKYSLCHLK